MWVNHAASRLQFDVVGEGGGGGGGVGGGGGGGGGLAGSCRNAKNHSIWIPFCETRVHVDIAGVQRRKSV